MLYVLILCVFLFKFFNSLMFLLRKDDIILINDNVSVLEIVEKFGVIMFLDYVYKINLMKNFI